MVVSLEAEPQLGVHAVSFPGGVARQYRIQYQALDSGQWQLYATFARKNQADHCLGRLSDLGFHARVIQYGCCPVGR